MTRRLYYDDSYLTEFAARPVEVADGGLRVYLDQTCFYPASGGQPNDLGELSGCPVVDVLDEGERVGHVLETPLAQSSGELRGRIDWPRRFEHMQQHTGQHLLSAVMMELFGFETVSFHLGSEVSTIDLRTPSLTAEQMLEAERRSNEVVFENRPVSVSYVDAAEAEGLRKPSERGGELRIVSIDALDRSACGGTHVRTTGEVGPVLLRKTEKIRGDLRLEFLCGGRAVRRARADFDALTQVARVFSCSLEEVPSLVDQQQARLREAERTNRRLAGELATRLGAELYDAASPAADGFRRHLHRVEAEPLDDAVRAMAQSFISRPGAVFCASSDAPPSVLLACSAGSGLHAGNLLRAALAPHGGRGGGSATMAQGSVPSKDALEQVTRALGGLTPVE